VLNQITTNTDGRKKRFVLLFDDLQSVHLFKDVGQIPFQMYKHYGFDAEIVCRRGHEPFLYVNDVLRGLKITVIDESPYRYLVRNARMIDVLMLMHISTRSSYRGLLYKFLNPKGCLYIKADMSGNSISYAQWEDQDVVTHMKRVLLRKSLISKVDIVSFETEAAYQQIDALPMGKKLHIPNGFDPDFINVYGVKCRAFADKENIILLVGRHGDATKNSEFMLDVLSEMGDLGSWKVYFVGPMTDGFKACKDAFLAENPRLQDRIVVTGVIDDKRALFELYSRAKILCLTSRSESWGMVCVEALCFGNVLVMTNVNSSADLTGNGKAGFIVEQADCTGYAGVLQRLMRDHETLHCYHDNALSHFNTHFIWKHILQHLAAQLTRRTLHETTGQRVC